MNHAAKKLFSTAKCAQPNKLNGSFVCHCFAKILASSNQGDSGKREYEHDYVCGLSDKVSEQSFEKSAIGPKIPPK
jgi:hypothetical protein